MVKNVIGKTYTDFSTSYPYWAYGAILIPLIIFSEIKLIHLSKNTYSAINKNYQKDKSNYPIKNNPDLNDTILRYFFTSQ